VEWRDAYQVRAAFSLAHPEFYEPLSCRSLTPEYVGRLKELLPPSWTIVRDDLWLHARCPGAAAARNRPQGFKVHVSSAPNYASEVLDLVVPVFVDEGVEFKLAGDPSLLTYLNAKEQHRGSSGKFMTIYPRDDATFKSLIERLYHVTRDSAAEGPYILSDRRYRDSRLLFYRYGSFRPLSLLNSDGTRTDYLVSPGGDLEPDVRFPYFRLPPWVEDPFDVPPVTSQEIKGLLHDRFQVEGALGYSNSGGVYFGTDVLSDREVVIKEARPFTNCWSVGQKTWDARYLLEREFKVLQRLDGLGVAPAPVDLFQEWEHTFLVEEKLGGITLDVLRAQEDVSVAPYILRPGTIERFLPLFKQLALSLIEMLEAVHARGVLLGDVSPRNVLFDRDSMHTWFIDFESAAFLDDEPEELTYTSRWGTPGFMNPDRLARGRLLREDDYFGAAMTLYGVVIPANYFFTLNPAVEALFLDRLIDLGLPSGVRTVIDCLKRGEVREADRALREWQV
jgi:hypothetical protein